MTPAIFYMSSIAFSITGMFFIWQLGLKKLMLDDFRDSLFASRDRLYRVAQEGRLDCDDRAYRAVEVFVNLTIRYAHRFTFLSFALSILQTDSQTVDAEAASSQMLKSISAVKDESVRNELLRVVNEVTTLLPQYIGKSSLMFIMGSIVYFVFRSVSPVIANAKQQAVKTFEAEAYRDSKFDGFVTA